VDRHFVVAGEFDRLGLEDLRSLPRQLLHDGLRDDIQPPCRRDGSWIGAENTVHIRVDLAVLRGQGGGERHRSGVRSTPPQRRHLQRLTDSLEACGDDDLPLAQLLQDSTGPHFQDPRIGVDVVGDDAALFSSQRDCALSQCLDGHAQKRHGDFFARRQQPVELPPGRIRADLPRHVDQVVRRMPHRRDDGNDTETLALRLDHLERDVADSLGAWQPKNHHISEQ
jgi:hypothetical protein